MHSNTDKHHNRLLRRADWRFLLNNPWPEKSYCLNSGQLADAVQAISTQFISAVESLPNNCDLVVATNPSSADLQKVWNALSDGGSFYCEWYSPLSGGAVGIRKRLNIAGFTDIVCYWAWPIPILAPALFWLPLDAKRVIRYFLSSRHLPKRLIARFKTRIKRLIWGVLWKTKFLAPICVTAQKDKRKVEATSQLNIDDEKLLPLEAENPIAALSRFDMLMWTGGKHSVNKVVLYLFPTDEEKPQLVVKLPRIAKTSENLTHEALSLQALHKMNCKAALNTPKVLFLHEWKGQVSVGETPVFGQPLFTVLDSKNSDMLAIKVTDWLAQLVVDHTPVPRTMWWKRLVEPVLSDFKESFGPVLGESVMFQCREILNRLRDLPQAFEHRDCSPWNLLITRSGELAVLDWESAEQNGLPGLDLIYFLTYFTFFVDGSMKNGNFIESYRRGLNPLTPIGHLQELCFQRYCESVGLDPLSIAPLRLLTWLMHSRSEIRNVSMDQGYSFKPDFLRRSFFYNLILEELANEYNPVDSQAQLVYE